MKPVTSLTEKASRSKNSWSGGTYLYTRRLQSFYNSVITKCAFVRCVCFGMEISCSIRTGLNTITTPYTVVLINKDNSIYGFICGSHRTQLHTWKVITMIAQLGDKNDTQDVF